MIARYSPLYFRRAEIHWRHRQDDSDTLVEDIFFTLTPIALTAAALLWLFG